MNTRCGYVAIVGRPNVGKSTLLNAFLGRKISITSRKPQTTRHRILGIQSSEHSQIIFVDTPGLDLSHKRLLNRMMNKAVKATLHDVDVILFVIEAGYFNKADEVVLQWIKKITTPVILVMNKIDRVKDRSVLLPFIQKLSTQYDFKHIIPLSSKHQEGLDALKKHIEPFLPEGVFLFESDQVTDRSDAFMVTEIVREKLMRFTGEEVPYAVTVTLEQFQREEKLLRLSAVIWVEKEGQKAILIGEKGAQMKLIGTEARKDLERFFNQKVFLQLWVKVKTGWSDNSSMLGQLGYDT